MKRQILTRLIRFVVVKKMAEKIFPYELPENWQWMTLGEICELSNGEKLSDKEFPYLDVKYLRGTKEKNLVGSGNFISEGTKVILVDGENSGEIFTVFENGYLGSTLRELRIFENVDEDFFQYFVSTKKNLYRQNKKGSAIPHLNKNLFYSTLLPLPPIDEQKRIVERLESLFSKLDKAKALAQNIIDNYELRRSSILHKAFTGQLTNPDLNDWKIFSWESCIKKMQNGISKRNGDTGDEIIVLRLYDIKNNEINLSNARTISLNDKEQENYLLKINDLLMIRVNGSKDNVGKQLLIKSSDKLAFCDHLIRIQYIDEIFPKYMLYFSQCKDYKDYVLANIVSSAGQNTISRKGMTNLNIPIPNIDEQKEIVRILDGLLAKEQRTKELAEQVLQKIDLMKKAILARAFRGELKTNEVIF